MEQLKKLYESLSGLQRVAIFGAIGVTLAAFGLVGWYTTNDYRPLYTSLSQQDAGAVVQKLKQSGVAYRLADNGGTILVPASAVAESRLEMALAGLPKTGRIGFELFDRTSLGVTEFAEHINYQRALEGELERSVMSLAEVEQARVHITFAKQSVFTESRQPAKASVLLKLRPGSQLEPRNVLAISHLLAAAVEGLTPRSVSILDMYGNLLSRPKNQTADPEQPSDSLVEYQQSLEKSLVAKINTTLEPLLGPEKFRAGVSVECDFTSGEESQESFDPMDSVIMTSQRTEETTGANGSSGIPGTASSLPRPRSEGSAAGTGVSRQTENITYQTSRTVRRTKIPQGSVKKISAAVLVDYAVRWEGEGDERKRILDPPPPDKMQAIRELVAAAIGLDPERGDQLIVQTLPFESTLQLEKPQIEPAPVVLSEESQPRSLEQLQQQLLERFQKRDPVLLTAAALAGFFVLVFLAWGIRRSRKRRRRVREESSPQALPAAPGSEGQRSKPLQEGAQQQGIPGTGAVGSSSEGGVPALAASKQQSLVIDVQGIVQKDPELSAGIIHGWLLEENEQ